MTEHTLPPSFIHSSLWVSEEPQLSAGRVAQGPEGFLKEGTELSQEPDTGGAKVCSGKTRYVPGTEKLRKEPTGGRQAGTGKGDGGQSPGVAQDLTQGSWGARDGSKTRKIRNHHFFTISGCKAERA